jgi:hypothetical protein
MSNDPSGGRSRTIASEQQARSAGGAASVEIAGFPQALYVRMLGDPDTLFIPLLEATREAYSLVDRLAQQGEDPSQSASLCSMHLASSLLRDGQFSLGARGMSPENSYAVDFEAGTLHVLTRLYSAVNRRIAFFKVELAGNIAGGPFVVRDPSRGTVIMQVEEERLREPNFFSTTLANECVRVQLDQEHFGAAWVTQEVGDVRVVMEIGGKAVPIVLRQQAKSGSWDMLQGQQQETAGPVPNEMAEHVTAFTAFLRERFKK